MILQIDHIVIYVEDLQQAIEDYRRLGFTTFYGGEHPGGMTHNALVVFQDGTYFELIAFLKPSEEHQWWAPSLRRGEGPVDYALLPGDIDADIEQARARGLDISDAKQGGRNRPDGVQVQWKTARCSTSDLPFLCFDLTPRDLRVPDGDVRRHPNGATGIARLTIIVAGVDQSAARYRALLEDAAQAPDDAATFRLGDAEIRLLPGAGAEGEGPSRLTLRSQNKATSGALDAALAHGTQIEFV